MKASATTAAIALFLATAATALALREEMFGNYPVGKRQGWAEGVVDVVNLESRIWLQNQLGETITCLYKGDIHAVNLALRKFATVKIGERRLILLPGPGKPFISSKPIEGDWQFFVPGDDRRSPSKTAPPVLTVYVNAAKPREPLDRKQAEKWIADLDDNSFQTRHTAYGALEKLGAAVKPLLRDTLKARPSPEVRRRIDALLAKLKGFDVDDLEIPDGLTVVTPGELLEGYLKDLSDPSRSGVAISGLVELAPYSDGSCRP
jgi:hypothetical protein